MIDIKELGPGWVRLYPAQMKNLRKNGNGK
jgi:hypothetical protein